MKAIFLLGTQRSGTTLLARMLSNHNKIFVQNEISVEKVFHKNASATDILSNISSQLEVRHKKSIADFKSNGIDIIGIKDPQLTENIAALKQFLPESKFIIIIRDARGVVNSYIDNKWGLGTNAYTGAKRWLREVREQQAFMQEAKNNFLLLKYEDLVLNAPLQLEKICIFLEIAYDTEMLNYYKNDAKYKTNRSNKNTNEKPNTRFAEKWKKELSTKEIGLIEHVAKDELLKHGYIPEGIEYTPNFVEKLFYNLHQTVLGEIQLQFQLKRSAIKRLLRRFCSNA